MEKKDLRVIKTETILFKTLLDLMKDNAFENIKVSDICSKALVNRSTFYAHYNDKYELFINLVDNLKQALLEELDKNKQNVNTKEYYLEMIKLILNHLNTQKDMYYPMIISNRNSIILDILLDVTVKDINKRLELDNINTINIPSNIYVRFYLGAVASVILEWISNSSKYTIEEIINYLDKLIPDNFNI